jgi:hypothetical protein
LKKDTIIYFALLLLVVMGAFASMALNAYGVWLMSYASLAFCLVFLFELISMKNQVESADRPIIAIELGILAAMCLMFFLKGQMIDFPLSPYSSQVLISLLLAVNIFNLRAAWRELIQSPLRIRIGVTLYYFSLFSLMAAMYFFAFSAVAGLGLTLGGLAVLVYFFLTSGRKSAAIINGVRISAVSVVSQLRGKSSLTIIVLVLLAGYSSLNVLNVLPPLYYGAMPNAYAKVVQRATKANGNGVQADAKAFEEAYKKFVRGK